MQLLPLRIRDRRIICRMPPARREAARHNGRVPGYWLLLQITIVICVLISAVIVVVKL